MYDISLFFLQYLTPFEHFCLSFLVFLQSQKAVAMAFTMWQVVKRFKYLRKLFGMY